MAKTIQELRQQLTDIRCGIDRRLNSVDLNQHDRDNLKRAGVQIDAARLALFDCELQS